MISPNDPVAMLNYAQECKQYRIPFAYDPSQQLARLSGEDLAQSVPGAAYLLCNEYELAMIQNKTGWSLDRLRSHVAMLVLTLGKKGSVVYHGDEEIDDSGGPPRNASKTRPARAMPIAAVFLPRWWLGCRLAVCGKMGSLCSVYALENMGTTAHRFTIDEFIARYTRDLWSGTGIGRVETAGIVAMMILAGVSVRRAVYRCLAVGLGLLAVGMARLPVQAAVDSPVTPSGFAVQTLVTGLNQPVDMEVLPNGEWLIAGKGQRRRANGVAQVRLVRADGLVPQPVLTFRSTPTATPVSWGWCWPPTLRIRATSICGMPPTRSRWLVWRDGDAAFPFYLRRSDGDRRPQ